MSPGERAFNGCLGISILAWGGLGLVCPPHPRLGLVRICITVLAVLVGGLVIVRRPLRRNGTFRSTLLAVPSFLTAGILFKLSPRADLWPAMAEWTFVVGTGLAVASMVWLGRSFAILPAVRRIVASGPYRWIRHPLYLGELLLSASCVLAAPDGLRLTGLSIATALLATRIRAEEQVLMASYSYRVYAQSVTWRLLPGVW